MQGKQGELQGNIRVFLASSKGYMGKQGKINFYPSGGESRLADIIYIFFY
jgi:hypothetical protein